MGERPADRAMRAAGKEATREAQNRGRGYCGVASLASSSPSAAWLLRFPYLSRIWGSTRVRQGLLGRVTGMVQGAAQLWRKSVFEAVGGYGETAWTGEDVDFLLAMRKLALGSTPCSRRVLAMVLLAWLRYGRDSRGRR